jgi:electron transfer flavoprotein alpha/beta subunit
MDATALTWSVGGGWRSEQHDKDSAMRAVALVKQVPDLRGAPVGVRSDGTIDRAGAGAITNPADLHALEAALNLADEVWALSMGPANAEKALREALSLGATRAVLPCDRMLAGSDTWATANALAAAIGWLGDVDLVVCGISALDGETGQVGPEAATRLGWPQATGCESLEIDGTSLIARRIVEGGFERLRLPLPAVVTIAETAFAPRYPTIIGRRRARTAVVERLDAGQLGLDPSTVGLAASPTKVAHMEPVPLPERSCRFVGAEGLTYDELVRALADVADVATPAEWSRPAAEPAESGDALPAAPFCDDPSVWVVCELDDGAPSRVSLELLSKATDLAPALGGGVGAVWPATTSAPRSTCWSATALTWCSSPTRRGSPPTAPSRMRGSSPGSLRPVAPRPCCSGRPRRGATWPRGWRRCSTPGSPPIAPISSWGRGSGGALISTPSSTRSVRRWRVACSPRACARKLARRWRRYAPGVFELRPAPRQTRIEVVPVVLEPTDVRVEVIDRETSAADVGLGDADVIIAGGAGCDASSWHLVEELATAFGGGVAASRGTVEAGLARRALQVGQTGTTVHPASYIACGISGALQHAVGMRTARTVLAINRDPDAFIFRLAHFGIVADVRDALPQLIAALRRANA